MLPYFRSRNPEKLSKTKLLFIIDGVLINAALVLTSGVFLSGYMIYLGGSDFIVGLLNNSLSWASIAALFSFLIYERMENRKTFLLVLLVLSRSLVCATIFIPLIFGLNQTSLYLVTAMVIIGNVIWGIYSIGSSVWMMASFTQESRNAFIFQRMFWLRISFTFFTIIMGYVLDWFGKAYTGFAIVFLISLVLSLGDAVILSKISEPAHKIAAQVHFTAAAFFEPLACRKYRLFMLFIFLFYASLTLSSSFTPLYLVRYLHFDYKFISLINVISYLFMIVCTRIWSRFESRIGLVRVFKLTGLVAIIEFLIYGFLTKDTYYLLYFAPIFAGIGNSGFNVFIVNYRYSLMPEQNRTVYEGWYGAAYGLSMLVGPALGSLIMNRLPVVENQVFQHSMFQLMYIISFFLAAGALIFAFNDHKPVSGRFGSPKIRNRS